MRVSTIMGIFSCICCFGLAILVEAITPITNTNIRNAIKLWMKNQTSALEEYGNISNWDTSKVTSMTTLFAPTRTVPELETFNDDISSWDTSNVEDFIGMFDEAITFNVDIGNWDTSSCTSMFGMFGTARAFDQDISGWDVSNVQDFQSMFAGATSFNQDLTPWGSSIVSTKVNTMFSMFYGATSFSQTLCWENLSSAGIDKNDANFVNTTFMFWNTNNSKFDPNCTSQVLIDESTKDWTQPVAPPPTGSPTMSPTVSASPPSVLRKTTSVSSFLFGSLLTLLVSMSSN